MSFRKKGIPKKNSWQFRNYTIKQGVFHMNFLNQKATISDYEL